MPATPGSPPKRMTRARAKAVEEKKLSTKSTAATTKTAASTAASRARAKTAPADDPIATADSKAKSVQSRSAARQTGPDPPNTRTRKTVQSAKPTPANGNTDETSSDPVPESNSVRGRTRKNTVTKEAPAPAKAAARSTRNTRAPGPVKSQAAAKKKVAFKDEDKENQVNEVVLKRPDSKDGKLTEQGDVMSKSSECAKKSASKPTTSKRFQETVEPPDASKKARTDPLSPKKGYQTTGSTVENGRPGSAGLDSKTDAKAGSPIKRSLKIDAQPQGEEDELQRDNLEPTTPSRTVGPSIMGSPPKRPPLSIQKNLKTSPSRLDISNSTAGHGEVFAIKDNSLLSQSPKKLGALATSSCITLPKPDVTENTLMMTQSPARRLPSPTKAFGHADVPATPGDHAKSLLQSPARRPPSTIKSLHLGSSKKADTLEGGSLSMTASRLQQKPLKFSMPPPKNPFASPDRLRQIAEASNTDEPLNESIRKDLSPGSLKIHDTASATPNEPVLSSKETVSNEGATEGFGFQSPALQWSSEVESEDELASDDPHFDASPARRRSLAVLSVDTSSTPTTKTCGPVEEQTVPMTSLAERFGAWAGATPDDRVLEQRKGDRSIFPIASLPDPFVAPSPAKATPLPAKSFDEAMEVHEDTDEDELVTSTPCPAEEYLRTSQVSDASQEYGDENALPADPTLQQSGGMITATCTPANVFSKRQTLGSHKVSRVPLKPAGEDTHPALSRARPARSQSLGGALTPRKDADLVFAGKAKSREAQTAKPWRFTERLPEGLSEEFANTPNAAGKSIDSWSVAATPARTPRANLDSKLLSGAVVFVDVHTSDGADASEIFVELLGQMGAKCVKQWNWNPHSMDQGPSESDQRVGITHVVFKDGGVRTMEKIRDAKGLVQCVGVGWVLDCERENKWMDESEYSIDESIVPRGGHRRRKSMEPKMLSLMNGTLSAGNSVRKQSGSVSPSTHELSPSKEFLNLDSPEDRRVSFAPLPVNSPGTPQRTDDAGRYSPKLVHAFGTPPDKGLLTIDGYENSPVTPYFSYASSLVQQTCPPKQTQQLLFPVSGDIDEEPDESLRQKLLTARRKSLQFAPRVRSPLVKDQ